MRLSESLRKGAMETFHGGIINRFKIKRRRDTLFFGDILSGYLKECERRGFREEMVSIGEEWMLLYFNSVVPPAMKKAPLFLLNMAMKRVWVNIGLMDDFRMEKRGDVVTIRTRNEALSRAIGENGFSVGLYVGILECIYGRKTRAVSVRQTIGDNVYVFRIGSEECRIPEGRDKESYDRLNRPGKLKGMTLEYAFRNRILELTRDNRIRFRGRVVYPVENTVFHVIGSRGVCIDSVQDVSYGFFSGLVSSGTDESRLVLLKTLLQAMGWGTVNIAVRKRGLEFGITNPPFGLQKQDDSWDFIARVILGYLWLSDRKFRIKSLGRKGRVLRIAYSR
jgi:hypothetical protein